MENEQELNVDVDSDSSNLIPLHDQLKLCSDILAESEEESSPKPILSNTFLSNENESFDILNKGISEIAKDSNQIVESDAISHNEQFRTLPDSSKTQGFYISKESIACVPKEKQEKELQYLGVNVYDQTEFESEVLGQVDKALKAQEEKRRINEVKKELQSVQEDIKFVKLRLNHISKAQSMAPEDPTLMTAMAKRELSAIKKEQENKIKHLKKLEAKQRALQVCINGDTEEVNNVLQTNIEGEEMDEETLYHLQKVFTAKETEEERLIRTGEMTPFGTVLPKTKPESRIIIPENELTDFDKFLLNEAESHESKKTAKPFFKQSKPSTSKAPPESLPKPISDDSSDFKVFNDLKAVHRKKRKLKAKVKLGSKHAKGFVKKGNLNRGLIRNYRSDSDMSDVGLEELSNAEIENYSSDDVYIPDAKISEEEDSCDDKKSKKLKSKKMRKVYKKTRLDSADSLSESESKITGKKVKKVVDDGNQEAYIKRIRAFEKSELVKKHQKILESEDGIVESEDDFTEFEEDYKIPNKIWNKLYKYQQTAVRWLWELHQQNCGGIIGDEMGLGKTIQMIAFLVGLKVSQLNSLGDTFKGLGPVILVCPATVMHQWVREFHVWWPPFRVVVLHESGSFTGKKDSLIRVINKSHGILVTSYAGVVRHQENLLEYEWHYVILDEGHKIRNPNAQATLAVKQFRTPHRIILSGSPIQNNLKELWSLFDFIFPGKLGTLPVFMQQFSVPIVLGGYSNASQVQVQTAYKCATVLRNTIKPYLLRRMKSDVKMSINLPNKNEQVLFCQLTEEQVNLYKGYINSKEVGGILDARLQVFVGLINLRKICNHPDLFDGGPKIFKDTDLSQLTEEDEYGYFKRSGKLIVVEALLKLWHKQEHRVLLFTQSKQMMEILEKFLKSRSYTYMKMDGTTPISSRQPAINKFNSDPTIFVFLLTTRVGGLGVNLTGADRVILYDPDWNPSTDAQARERAWRIGQEKQVTIYRLLTAGTIEEKIYHRQIFKQFVTNRVLKDPRQRRFFKSNDLFELFTYNEVGPQGTETSAIFAGTGSEVKVKKKSLNTTKKHSPKDLATIPTKQTKLPVSFSEKKREQMKELAKKLSLELTKKKCEVKEEQYCVESSEPVQCTKNDMNIKASSNKDNLKNSVKCSSKMRSSNKEKKRKAAKIEGEKIDFVVKKSVYKAAQDDDEKNLKQDDYVLSKLFKKSGVHTALKHDSIVEASDPDYMIVEGEAKRVAKEAIKALRESRRLCARAEEGVPTWTGQHGELKPRFGQKKKLSANSFVSSQVGTSSNTSPKTASRKLTFDGKKDSSSSTPSSTDLLSAIKKRKVVFGTDANSDDSDQDSTTSTPKKPQTGTEHDELLVDIRNFVAFGAAIDGQASTKEIIEAFKTRLPVHQTAVFKSMLSKICDFSRSSSGEGMWHLKSEFR